MKDMQIKDRFKKDVENHSISIRMDDGVYRHIVCSNNGRWNQRFDIVTYPGYLVVSGDMGEWVFSRTKDMFEFFRRADGGINPGYWAEKCCAGKTSEFSKEKFRDVVMNYVRNYYEDDKEALDELMEAVEAEIFDPVENSEENAYSCLNEFEFCFESHKPVPPVFRFCDTFELSFTDYTHHFLWALHAIVWAINRYDSARGKKS